MPSGRQRGDCRASGPRSARLRCACLRHGHQLELACSRIPSTSVNTALLRAAGRSMPGKKASSGTSSPPEQVERVQQEARLTREPRQAAALDCR